MHPPSLAAALYLTGNLQAAELPMLAAHWLVAGHDGPAVCELAGLRRDDPRVEALWSTAIVEVGIDVTWPDALRSTLAWAARVVLAGHRDLAWFVRVVDGGLDRAPDDEHLVGSSAHLADRLDTIMNAGQRPDPAWTAAVRESRNDLIALLGVLADTRASAAEGRLVPTHDPALLDTAARSVARDLRTATLQDWRGTVETVGHDEAPVLVLRHRTDVHRVELPTAPGPIDGLGRREQRAALTAAAVDDVARAALLVVVRLGSAPPRCADHELPLQVESARWVCAAGSGHDVGAVGELTAGNTSGADRDRRAAASRTELDHRTTHSLATIRRPVVDGGQHLFSAHHDAVVEAVTEVAAQVAVARAAAAFLSALGSGPAAGRSAPASLAVARTLEPHPFDGDRDGRHCAVCGTEEVVLDVDLRMAEETRRRWGLPSDDLVHVLLDLHRVATSEPEQPTDTDHAAFAEVLSLLASAPARATPAQITGARWPVSGGRWGRRIVLDVLGILSVLRTPGHPAPGAQFVPFADRTIPDVRHAEEWSYPTAWWRGADGIDLDAARAWGLLRAS